MEVLKACPLCNATDLSVALSCQDYTVSHEVFTLQQCNACGFLMTNPRPDETSLPRYYESPAYISHTNTSASLIDRAYKFARTFTLRWKLKIVCRHAQYPPTSLLDYGCGTGAFLTHCKQNKLHTTGVEPSATARAQAIESSGSPIFSTIHDIKEKVDAITLWHVLEHVADLDGTLQALASRLNPRGTMFIAVPNYKSLDASHYHHHWAAYDVPRHLWHFSRFTITRLLERNNLNLVAVRPMPLDAYYVSLLSEKYKAGRHSASTLVSACLRAWQSNRHARNTHEYSSLIYIVRKQS